MHDNVLLAGPVWAFATFLVILAVGLMLYVLLDSLRTRRRASVAGHLREPLWLYTAFAAAYLLLLVVVQVMRGLQLGAAIVTAATPAAIGLGFAYLLRVVFPKPRAFDDEPSDNELNADELNADELNDEGRNNTAPHTEATLADDDAGDEHWFDLDDGER